MHQDYRTWFSWVCACTSGRKSPLIDNIIHCISSIRTSITQQIVYLYRMVYKTSLKVFLFKISLLGSFVPQTAIYFAKMTQKIRKSIESWCVSIHQRKFIVVWKWCLANLASASAASCGTRRTKPYYANCRHKMIIKYFTKFLTSG